MANRTVKEGGQNATHVTVLRIESTAGIARRAHGWRLLFAGMLSVEGVMRKMNVSPDQGKSENEQVPAESDTADNRMEQIRELMFGGTVRELEHRIRALGEKLDGDLTRTVTDAEQRLAAMDKRMVHMGERIDEQLRQESATRINLMDDLESRLNQVWRAQRAEILAAVQQVETYVKTLDAQNREALSRLESAFKTALQSARDSEARARAELSQQKLSREDLADLMAEVAIRLRGTQKLPDGG